MTDSSANANDEIQPVSFARFVWYFFWLGTVGFGGPIALAGHMQQDLVDSRRWISKQDYLDGLALAQLAPGPLAAQLAMYLGYVHAGILGATAVAIAFVLPSFLMVFALSFAYVRYGGLLWMQAGFFVFGNGLAVVPFLYGGVVHGHHWLTDQQFVDAVAVAMITPGPVVITVAFIGYLVKGVWGATAAAVGIFLPVYLVVILLAPSYQKWAKNPQLKAFVGGVTAAATGAIAGAVVVLARRSLVDIPTLLIGAATLLLLFRWKIPEPALIAGSALLGLVLRSR